MDFDTNLRQAVYQHFVRTGQAPLLAQVAAELACVEDDVRAGYARWRRTYFANSAWDALGIPAALHQEAVVHSSCGQSGAPLRLQVGPGGPEPSQWLFHCQVPAARWWADLVFT